MNSKKLILASLATLCFGASALAADVTMSLGRIAYLPECGGTIAATKSEGQGAEQVNIVINGVSNCTTVKIKKVNGDSTGDKAHPLQMQHGALGGSFTLKKNERTNGYEETQIIVGNPSGGTNDRVTIEFINIPVAPAPTIPANPGNPSTGGGN